MCRIHGLRSLNDLDLYSDIVTVNPAALAAAAAITDPVRLDFPLDPSCGPCLCSQAAGGRLTHFAHGSTWHAVDFDAPVGTTLLAVADGTVAELKQVRTPRASSYHLRIALRVRRPAWPPPHPHAHTPRRAPPAAPTPPSFLSTTRSRFYSPTASRASSTCTSRRTRRAWPSATPSRAASRCARRAMQGLSLIHI